MQASRVRETSYTCISSGLYVVPLDVFNHTYLFSCKLWCGPECDSGSNTVVVALQYLMTYTCDGGACDGNTCFSIRCRWIRGLGRHDSRQHQASRGPFCLPRYSPRDRVGSRPIAELGRAALQGNRAACVEVPMKRDIMALVSCGWKLLDFKRRAVICCSGPSLSLFHGTAAGTYF